MRAAAGFLAGMALAVALVIATSCIIETQIRRQAW